jgi:hypothetical protein
MHYKLGVQSVSFGSEPTERGYVNAPNRIRGPFHQGLGAPFPSTFHTNLGAIFPPKRFSETGPSS